MSQIVKHLELHPSRYDDPEHEECHQVRGFLCPTCCARGYLGGIAHNEEKYPCPRCKGTGRLKAIVTVKWSSDYYDTRWQPK